MTDYITNYLFSKYSQSLTNYKKDSDPPKKSIKKR